MQTVPTQEAQIAAPFVRDSSGARASFLQRVCAALFEPVDISFLVFFRIVFGWILLWALGPVVAHALSAPALRRALRLAADERDRAMRYALHHFY